MKILIRHMIYQHFLIHGFILLFLLAVLAAGTAVGGDFLHVFMGFYLYGLMFFVVFKPYSMLNAKWLNVLPMTRKKLLGFVAFEGLVALIFGLTVFFGMLLIGDRYNANFTVFSEMIEDLQSLPIEPKDRAFYLFLSVIAISPLFIFFQSRSVEQTNAYRFSNLTTKQKTYFAFAVLIFPLGVIFVPILTIATVFALVLGEMGNRSIKTLFPMRNHRKWASVYGATIAVSIFAQMFMLVEMSTQKEVRPLVRLDYYGYFAPRIPRETVFDLIANPNVSDKSRRNIVLSERARIPDNEPVSADELQKWSKMAPNNHIYFHGLALFHGKLWTAQSLIQFESDLKQRCLEGFKPSKWVPGWTCNLDSIIREKQDGDLNIWFMVKNDHETLSLLSEEHPIIASMLIKAALWVSTNDSWKTRMQDLEKSGSPVLAQQAAMWLERLSLNPSGEWECPIHPRKLSSVCVGSEAVNWEGIRVESKVDGDPGAWFSLYVKNAKLD